MAQETLSLAQQIVENALSRAEWFIKELWNISDILGKTIDWLIKKGKSVHNLTCISRSWYLNSIWFKSQQTFSMILNMNPNFDKEISQDGKSQIIEIYERLIKDDSTGYVMKSTILFNLGATYLEEKKFVLASLRVNQSLSLKKSLFGIKSVEYKTQLEMAKELIFKWTQCSIISQFSLLKAL